ncbi:CHAT domain-containing protein [Amycolatopsis sp. cmx-4-54]|uniref:CHAT domain-containing protein n=1 Tax=Amycolatopsis sp. cmx-4-54 TaxID=2790936 RepID=UPI003978AFE5
MSTEWTRVLVRLSEDDVTSFAVAKPSFERNALDHLIEVAETIAIAYGFENVDAAHIAVALSLTRNCTSEDVSHTVAEAFGLGTLNRLDEVMNQHAIRKEQVDDQDQEGPPSIGFTVAGGRWKRAVSACYLTAIGAAVGMIVVYAIATGSLLGWLIAPLTAITARDKRQTPFEIAERVKWMRVSLRWPVQGVLAVLAVSLGEPLIAGILVTQLLVVEVIVTAGEAVTAGHDTFEGEGFEGVPFAVRRLASVPDSFLAGQRLSSLALALLFAVAPTALAVWFYGSVWPLYVVAALVMARGLTGFASLTLIVATAAYGFEWPAAVAMVAGLFARLVVAWLGRPPVAYVPVPQRGVRGIPKLRGKDARKFRQAKRLLRRGLPGAASRALGEHSSSRVTLVALNGWALVRAGHLGEALKEADRLPAEFSCLRALVVGLARLELGQPEVTLDMITTATTRLGRGRARKELAIELSLARLRARVATGERGLSTSMALAIPRTVTRSKFLYTMVLLRLVAESDPRYSSDAQGMIAGTAFSLHRSFRADREMRFLTFLGSERVADLESIRAAILFQLSEISQAQGTSEVVESMGRGTGAAEFLLRMDRPLEAAAVLNHLADYLETTPSRLEALDTRVEAVATLHWARHQLHDLVTRRLWWARMSVTLESAMRQAADGHDWTTLAELIETARLQFAPRDEETPGTASAPFIQVRGISRLAASIWYQADENSGCYDLERLAEVVLGRGTWWWSTWSTGSSLYWALVPPDGDVSGGVAEIGPDTDLGMTLRELRVAAPAPWPGEVVGDSSFQERMESSVLFGPLPDERELARRLAALLPPRLRDRLSAPGKPVNIALAPAEVLAAVPWAAISVGLRDVRLTERARLAIAPPAALLAAMARRPKHDGDSPLSLAMLNPGGALGTAKYDLITASALQYGLPDGVRTINRADQVDLDELSEILRSLPARSSAIYACHTAPGDGEPLSAGLQLCPPIDGRPPIVLSANALINSPERFPVPGRGLVLACDSADLNRTAGGEWLVLGTALLWAGARQLVVTGFPVVDSDVLDKPLLYHLMTGGDLVDGLREIQMERLREWQESGIEDVSPAIWGSHIAIGSFSTHAVTPEAEIHVDRHVDEWLITLLDSAAMYTASMGRFEVTPLDVLHALAIHGFMEDLPTARRLVLQGVNYSLATVAACLAFVRKRRASSRKATLRADVIRLVSDACVVAKRARHRMLTIEHLLVAAMAHSGASAWVARLLSGWDGRDPEFVKEVLSECQDGLRALGRPEIRNLDLASVKEVYRAYGADLPVAERSLVRLSDL